MQLTNLPAGVYTVRAFPASSGRWLRTEGKLLTEVPWIFAVPTGANKVAVYWDEVPGATGYRVRWRKWNEVSYPPENVLVVGADVRHESVAGLEREQEYYFVVEAAYNGLWGPPSEEDSAVPHEGAIRWDSGNVSWIMEDVRRAIGSRAGYDELEVLGPDYMVYSDSGIRPPAGWIDPDGNVANYSNFPIVPLTNSGREHWNTHTGPYRRVRTSVSSNVKGAKGSFWLPAAWYISIRPDGTARRVGDTPYMYFGIAFGNIDVEAGVLYHPEWRYPEGWTGPRYPRWQVYFHYRSDGRKRPVPVVGDPLNPFNHIRVDDRAVSYGAQADIELIAFGKQRLIVLRVEAFDDLQGERLVYKEMVGIAKLAQQIQGARFRRVHSIAQNLENTPWHSRGYARTGSTIFYMGAGWNPYPFGAPLPQPIQVLVSVVGVDMWVPWTNNVTDQAGWFPSDVQIVFVNVVEPYFREGVNIRLPFGD